MTPEKARRKEAEMALKTIRVRIKSVEQALGDAIDTMRAIQSRQKVEKQRGEYFESLEAVRAALTEKRLALVRLVREKKPGSVAELARLARRDFKSVYRDVEALRDLGLITIGPSRRGVSSPLRTNATEIVLRIAV
jgi:predicted transcriptional regulator